MDLIHRLLRHQNLQFLVYDTVAILFVANLMLILTSSCRLFSFLNNILFMKFNNLILQEIIKFFKGDRELTPENWQSFIQELYGAGMQEYCEELTRQYNRAFGIE